MSTYIINFFDASGKCYFKHSAIHIDISTYTTLIDFGKTPLIPESSGIFRSYDELQTIQIISNVIKLTYVSGQHITITKC